MTPGWNAEEYLALDIRRWLDGSAPIPLVKVTPEFLWKMHVRFAAHKMGLEEPIPLFVMLEHHAWMHWDGQAWAETDEFAVSDSSTELFRGLTYTTDGVPIGPGAETGLHMLETSANALYFFRANHYGFRNMSAVGETLAGRSLLSCKNGLLDLRTRELLPHSPYFFALGHNEIEFDPEATCPAWVSLIDRLFPVSAHAEHIRKLALCVMACERNSHITVLTGSQPATQALVAGVLASLVHESLCANDAIQPDSTYLEQCLSGRVALSIVSTGDDWEEGGLSTCSSLEMFLNAGSDGLRPKTLQGQVPAAHDPWGSIETTLALSEQALDIQSAAANRGMGVKTIQLPSLDDSLIDVHREAIDGELPGILNWALDSRA